MFQIFDEATEAVGRICRFDEATEAEQFQRESSLRSSILTKLFLMLMRMFSMEAL